MQKPCLFGFLIIWLFMNYVILSIPITLRLSGLRLAAFFLTNANYG